MFGHQVVEPREVAEQEALTGVRGITAVVVVDRVVEPVGDLAVLLARRQVWGIGVIGARQMREVRVSLVRALEPEKAIVDRCAFEAATPRVGVLRLAPVRARRDRALAVADDVGRVIDDDVQIDLHAARVGGAHQRIQIGVGSEMRVDVQEVGDPVAMVAGALAAGRSLDGLIDEHGCEP